MSAPRNAVVWIEIPVTDMSRATAFYSAVLEQELTEQDDGPNPIAVFTCDGEGVSGHLYPGTPAVGGQGSTVHLAAPGDLATTMKRVSDAGGSVVGEIVAIPAGSFFYAQDPDGNSIGFFER